MTPVFERLSQATAASASEGVVQPLVDPRSVSPAILHLGLGAFHRGHQAMITEDAMAAAGDPGWGIVGTSQRSRDVVDQLVPQDCLYTMLQKSPQATSARIVGSIRDALFPGDDHDRILRYLASSSMRIISLTITEKGYLLGPDGGLDASADDVQADLAALAADVAGSRHAAPSATAIGMLARGLTARALSDGAPVTVLPCDNMVANGQTLHRQVTEFLAASSTPAAMRTLDWIASSVAFTSTVVDRMVPITGEGGRAQVAATIGLRDDAAVLAEPFWQWVMQNDFRAGRPAWDRVGAEFADDVEPYEQLKLRILNSSHSLLAYLGALAGFATIAQSVAVPEFEAAAWQLIADEAIPGLDLPEEIDPVAYGRSVLERYRNSALGHQTIQVAMDGSQKLPLRIIPTALAALARGEQPRASALTVASWMVFVARGRDVDGRQLALSDPRAAELREAAAGAEASLAERMLALRWVFPEELATNTTWRELVADAVNRFRSDEIAAWARA